MTKKNPEVYYNRLLRVIDSALSCPESDLKNFSQVSEDIQGIVDQIVGLRRDHAFIHGPACPAPHLECTQLVMGDKGDAYRFNDGSVWFRWDINTSWSCQWQPKRDTVSIDRNTLQSLTFAASSLQDILAAEIQNYEFPLQNAITTAKAILGDAP